MITKKVDRIHRDVISAKYHPFNWSFYSTAPCRFPWWIKWHVSVIKLCLSTSSKQSSFRSSYFYQVYISDLIKSVQQNFENWYFQPFEGEWAAIMALKAKSIRSSFCDSPFKICYFQEKRSTYVVSIENCLLVLQIL